MRSLRRVCSASLVAVLALASAACASSVSSGASRDGGREGSAGEGGVVASDASVVLFDGDLPVSDDAGGPTDPPVDVVTPPVGPDAVSPPGPDASPPARDAGFPVAPDGAVVYPPDAGYAPGVRCGDAVCTTAQECCPDRTTRALTCVARGACMGPSAVCDGPEDCPSSQRCCLAGGTGGGAMTEIGCFPMAECSRVPVLGAVLPCHTNADCPATARRCCNVSGLSFGMFSVPAGIPSVCAPLCPTGG